MRRTNKPKKDSLRRELELYVVAWNSVLKDAVHSMDIIILLRNAHPAYRGSFVTRLLENGVIHKTEASEFISGPILRSTMSYIL